MKNKIKFIASLAFAASVASAFTQNSFPCTGGVKLGCSRSCPANPTASSYKCVAINIDPASMDFDGSAAEKSRRPTSNPCALKYTARYDAVKQLFICDKTSSNGCGSVPTDSCNAPVE